MDRVSDPAELPAASPLTLWSGIALEPLTAESERRLSADDKPRTFPGRLFVRKEAVVPTTLPGMILGPLERRILAVTWEFDECSVREVMRRLTRKRAYTTVMTTLDRLYQKGILNRTRVGGRFLYSARLGRQELEKIMARDLVARVLGSSTTSRELIVSSLLEAIRRQDARLFDKSVVTMTRAKRRRLG